MTAPATSALPPLAEPEDLAAVAFAPLPDDVASSLLAGASAAVRSYCRWAISATQYAVDLDSEGAKIVLLPAMQVQAVSVVRLAGVDVDASSFSWSASGVLEAAGRWPRGRRNLHVEFIAGYDPVPADVTAAVCSLAARTVSVRGGWTQQRIGSLSLGQALTAGGGLDDHERSMLAGYRLP